jgi:hypothetical protein
MHVSEAEMSEAVHVAGAMAAGIALVHSVQMMNKLDQFSTPLEAMSPAGAGIGR